MVGPIPPSLPPPYALIEALIVLRVDIILWVDQYSMMNQLPLCLWQLLKICVLLINIADSTYVKKLVCPFENGDLCGWQNITGGIMLASKATAPLPMTDSDPGNINGSYFFYQRQGTYSNDVTILSYPRQRYVSGISFDYYVSGITLISVNKIDYASIDVVSWTGNNATGKWEHTSVNFTHENFSPDFSINIVSSNLEEVLGEAAVEIDSTLCIDRLTIEFSLPCNFDALSSPGNLVLSNHIAKDIPLGEVTIIPFVASSVICPNGPFVYYIKSNDKPVLNDIFSINETTGDLTIDATGSNGHLVATGVNIGVLEIAVIVKDSDYLDSGEYAESTSLFVYQQDPTITVQSPNTIEVQQGVNFTYTIMATSELGSTLEYSMSQTKPESLVEALSLDENIVKGLITSTDLLNIIKTGKQPTFFIDVSDTFGGTITLKVQLMLPATPPTFDKEAYVFKVVEESKSSNSKPIGNFTVGDINENSCNDINVTLDANGYSDHFKIVGTGNIFELCVFLVYSKVSYNYEVEMVYQLSIVATDSSGKSTTAMVTVNVVSVNEFKPMFDEHNGEIETDYMSEVGKFIYLLSAQDNDEGPAGQLSYKIISGNDDRNFKLEQMSNEEVELQSNSAGLLLGVYDLTIMVFDGQEPVKNDTMNMIVVVTQAGSYDCTNGVYGPPEVAQIITIKIFVAAGDDIVLQCNHTSFPPSYPVVWLSSDAYEIDSIISHDNPHYLYNGSNLTVLNVSPANENFLYRCNVSNPCGSSLSGHTHLSVIELPNPINDLTISEGPDINNRIDLVWTPPPVPPISHRPRDGYKVMVMGEEPQYKFYTTLSSDASKTRLTNLKPGTNYTVMVMPYNLAGEAQSNVVNFNTNTSAPKLTIFIAESLTNHSIRIEWSLAYNGGSEVSGMSIDINDHFISKKKKRSTASSTDFIPMTFDVEVDQQILITPAVPYGRSYEISATIINIYGSTQYVITTFVGFQDMIKCSFTNTSTCSWKLGNSGSLQSGIGASFHNHQPQSDATGTRNGSYVIGQLLSPDTTQPILYHHDISYLCGYSFYYQTYEDVRLILMSASSIWNETVYWISQQENVLDWMEEEVPIGDIPISATPRDMMFVMETFSKENAASFVAIDEVSLHFCLPCDYSVLNNDLFRLSGPSDYTVYMRSYQKLIIEATIDECLNPVLSYAITEVTPSFLESAISIPNPREGVIVIADVTPYITTAGTEGQIQVTVEVPGANYKNNGLALYKSLTIPFTVSEIFENCSYINSCYFEEGPCDWKLSDQSNVAVVADSSGNNYVLAKPSQTNDKSVTIIETLINDSYCGMNFLYKIQQGSTIQVSVDGLGILWSSDIKDQLGNTATMQSLNTSSWKEVSLYIDIMGVEMMSGRMVTVDMALSDGDSVNTAEMAAGLDNITLHPCLDCQAKDCSCISCIQQCSSDPCQSGYYLSLEINQCRPCPKGHYCTTWRSVPIPCPPGTFINTTGASTIEDCKICPDGSYSLKTGAWDCDDCPIGYDCLEAGKLPVAHSTSSTSSEHFIPSVIGAILGCALLLLLATLIGMYFYCRTKKKEKMIKKYEKSVCQKNFLYGLDEEERYSGGPKTGTVRTASTILSLNDARFKHETIQNDGYYDNSESSDDDKEVKENPTHLLPPLGQFSNTGTVSSLKSLDSSRGWRNVNPFSTSESESNMSALIELDDEKDHVWSALKKKKEEKNKKNKPESNF